MALGIWVVFLLLPIICCSACLEEEKISLLDFKQGLNFTYYREIDFPYDPLESWRGFNCCAWEGVGCHPSTGHVLTLEFHEIQWSEIRGGLFQLLHLEHLDLTDNSFYSLSIPPQIGELRRLKYLSLSECGFIGRIPTELTKLQQLEHLDLHGNNLQGVVPREIGNMSTFKFGDWITNLRGLKDLVLSGNNLTMVGDSWLGSIASLTNLTIIQMSNCGLSGEIPPSFANLSRLQVLDLSSNSLRGKIPAFVGALPLSLLSLDLSYNNLEGSLPSSLGGLSKLQLLRVNSNKLNGSVSSTLGNLSAMIELDLGDNSFSGSIPTSFANLSKIEILGLSNNKLNGTFSFFILNNCPKLHDLDLSSNMLTVEVNASAIPKFQLWYLDLHDCNIRGNFPTFISTQYFIMHLDLSNNSLSEIILVAPFQILFLNGRIWKF